jgi:hypothetical protein
MSKSKAPAVPREQDWLNGSERDRLRMLEAAIDAGARAFVVMGTALAEIRDSRLYRENFDTFEAYCKAKWDLSRSRSYELMDAAGIAERVSGIPDTPQIESASVATELVPLRDDPQAMSTAIVAAHEKHGDHPTAAQVREIVRGAEGDIRWSRIENAADSMKTLPAWGKMPWPMEDGDCEAMNEALDWLCAEMPAARREWRAYWKALKAQKRKLRAVA